MSTWMPVLRRAQDKSGHYGNERCRHFPATVMPSILTGLILAMARAAGEVAPLMITGVVKLAPSLPLDTNWPFLHMERKFMHL